MSKELTDSAVWGSNPLAILASYDPQAAEGEDTASTASKEYSNTTCSSSSSRAIAPKINWETMPRGAHLLDKELFSWVCRLVPAGREALVAYPGTLKAPLFTQALKSIYDTFKLGSSYNKQSSTT